MFVKYDQINAINASNMFSLFQKGKVSDILYER